MENYRELAQLKERIDALETSLASKEEVITALSDLRSSVKSIEDKIGLSDRFSKIEEEHESWKTLAKYITVTVSILGILLGYLGFKSIDKLFQEQLDKRFTYSSNLAYGLALVDKHPSFSLKYLLQCFQERPFDEPLLISLLSAADSADDWETTRTVMEELRKHPVKIASFSNALTYNNIGLAELNLGFENRLHFARARDALEKGTQIAESNRLDVLWYLHTNLWRYYIVVDDLQHAKHEVEIAKGFDPPQT
jgi:uncharacterized coiled-coil protein SlyX